MSIFSHEGDYPETIHSEKRRRSRGMIEAELRKSMDGRAAVDAPGPETLRNYISVGTQLDEHLTHEVQPDPDTSKEVLDLASLIRADSLYDVHVEPDGGRSEYDARVRRIREGSVAPATIARIASAKRQIEMWGTLRNVPTVPMGLESAVMFVTDLIDFGYAISSIRTYFSTIRKMHRLAGEVDPLDHPLIAGALRMARRARGDNPERKEPFLAQDVRASLEIARKVMEAARGVREFAELAIGHAGAFRPSELAGILYENVIDRGDGLDVFLPRSKTDQYASGVHVHVGESGVPWCPVAAFRRLRRCMGVSRGPVFRRVRSGEFGDDPIHSQEICRVVKRYAGLLGHDPAEFGGHSLRVGFITDAFDNGVDDVDIMRHVRHLNPETTYAYHRPRTQKNLTKVVAP